MGGREGGGGGGDGGGGGADPVAAVELETALREVEGKIVSLQEATIGKMSALLVKKESVSAAALKMIRLNVQRRKQARWAKADAERRARADRARLEGEMMAARVKELLAVEPPDHSDPELLEYIAILRSQTHACAALCGSPWQHWEEPGACQVCMGVVDVAERGQQCQKKGHWICWGCMV
eukprot:SAG11_NODE_4203_length_2015_cov_2.158664_1_plen_179_part_01